MDKFIKVTYLTNVRGLIKVSQIVAIEETNDGCAIAMKTKAMYRVKETFNEVLEAIITWSHSQCLKS